MRFLNAEPIITLNNKIEIYITGDAQSDLD